MRLNFALAVCGAFAMTVYAAGGLEGNTFTVKTGSRIGSEFPVTLPYDGPEVEGAVTVEHTESGTTFPATVRNGVLVFVADGADTDSEYELEVSVSPQPRTPQVRVEKQEGKDVLDVYVLDKHFVTYNYGSEWKKPFLWPVKGVNGIHLTRDWPMVEPSEEKSTDHVHQKSMWTAHGAMNGVDFWGEGDNSGRQVSSEVTYGSGDAYGWIHAKNTWVDKDGKPVISEEREYRFYATPEYAHMFDARIAFTAAHGDVLWGDTKEGGIMALRIRPSMEERKGGVITTSNGVGSKDHWGKPAAWCDYSGDPDGSGVQGITIMDHPGNFRHPANWHVRDYGLNGANYFGYEDFYPNEGKNGDHPMKSGESLTFNYRVYVHRGGADQADVADRYADFATPATAAWNDN